jgi:hypothetical protein
MNATLETVSIWQALMKLIVERKRNTASIRMSITDHAVQ